MCVLECSADAHTKTRYAMCALFKRPVVVSGHVFLVDAAFCVVSRFPFFEILSFILKGVCEIEQRWTRDNIDCIFESDVLRSKSSPPVKVYVPAQLACVFPCVVLFH